MCRYAVDLGVGPATAHLWAFKEFWLIPSILSVFPFLLGWRSWEVRAETRLPGSSLPPQPCWYLRSQAGSRGPSRELSRVREIHGCTQIELRSGIVARKQLPTCQKRGPPGCTPMTVAEEAGKYKRMGEIAFSRRKSRSEALRFHANASCGHSLEFHLSQVCEITWLGRHR